MRQITWLAVTGQIPYGAPVRCGTKYYMIGVTLLFSVYLFMTASVPYSVAADPLEDWLNKAMEQNQQIIAARQAWEAAKERAPQARSFDDPMVGVEFMRMDSTRFDDYDTTEVMVSQRLPWFGKRRARIDTADRGAEVAGFRYLEKRRDVRARLTTAYWQLWVAQRAVEINRENLELLTQFEKIARARYEAGQGLQADVLRAQVERDRLETDLLTMKQDLEVAQARINRLLSEPVQTPREVSTTPAVPELPGMLTELYDRATTYNSMLRSMSRMIDAREAAVRSARLNYAPNFELRVMARQHDGQSGFQEYDTGVAINIPWLWRGKYDARVREARAELDQADAQYQDMVDRTFLNVREFHASADAGLRTVRLFEDVILPRTREFLDSTRAAYESGRVTLLELINAQRAWEDTHLAYERTRARYGADVAKLEEITQPWTEHEIESGLISPERTDNEDTTHER